MIATLRHRPVLLALVPILTYTVSYLYLACYHRTWALFGAIVHESGRYTLFENTFYAPHFLGHIPVLITLAFLMVGSYQGLTPTLPISSRREFRWGIAAIVALVGVSLVASIAHWGPTETWEFIRQQRQRPDLLVPGGSWLLHLPSTLSLIVGLPLFVFAVRWFFDRPTELGSAGRIAFGIGLLSVPVVTWWVVPQPLATAMEILGDPRYLAHGVRELATFPLTYFPLPLAWWLTREPSGGGFRWTRKLVLAAAATAVVFAAILAYEVIVPLEHGVGDLAQQPDFAHGGQLSVAYLLASHYFEHFLDTLFFALLCLLLMPPRPPRVA